MRMNSLYKFFKIYFGYTSKLTKLQRKNYALAISDTTDILEDVIKTRNYSQIQDYLSQEMNHPLVVKFLENIEILACNRYDNPLGDIDFYNATITIDDQFITSRRRGIEISCPYILDKSINDIVIITFGQTSNIIGEVKVLKGLINEFKIDLPWPKEVRYLTYWDLSACKETTENFVEVKPEPRWKLLNVINEI